MGIVYDIDARWLYNKAPLEKDTIRKIAVEAYLLASSSSVSDHNDLTGLQGGNATERYHLLSSQVSGLVSGSTTALHKHEQTTSHESVDTDTGTGSIHHTLGLSSTQAAAGNHTHLGYAASVTGTDKHAAIIDGTGAAQGYKDGGVYPWEFRHPIDLPPVSPTAYDDEFEGNSLNVSWGWINNVSASAAVSNGELNMTFVQTLGGQPRLEGLYKTPPAGACEFTACFGLNGWTNGGDVMRFGLSVASGSASSGSALMALAFTNNGLEITYYTYTTFTNAPTTVVQRLNHANHENIYFRWSRDVANNWIWSVSFTGNGFIPWLSGAGGFTVNSVGIAGENYRAFSGPAQPNMVGICRWFRQTA